MMALIVGSTNASLTAICSCTLRSRLTRDFAAAVHLGLALLPAEALHVHDRQADDLDLGEGGFHVLELAGLDDGDDEFHGERLRVWRLQAGGIHGDGGERADASPQILNGECSDRRDPPSSNPTALAAVSLQPYSKRRIPRAGRT